MQPKCFPELTQTRNPQVDMAWRAEKQRCTHCTLVTEATPAFIVFLIVCLTGLQPIHVLQPDDVPFVKAERTPVFSDVVPHCHNVLRVLADITRCPNTSLLSSAPAWFIVYIHVLPGFTYISVWSCNHWHKFHQVVLFVQPNMLVLEIPQDSIFYISYHVQIL